MKFNPFCDPFSMTGTQKCEISPTEHAQTFSFIVDIHTRLNHIPCGHTKNWERLFTPSVAIKALVTLFNFRGIF